uniref:IKBKB interacting protein n=1 Tax=Leptobrachium leishanense TaxID=445787 RepID=A0A8C5QL40_9ANUR
MMSTEVKQRKKVSTSKEGKDGQPMAPPTAPQIRDEVPGKTVVDPAFKQQRPPIVEVRTVLCLLCLAICGALSWFVFEQSRTFSILEHRYQSLQTRSEALEELGDKIRLVFGKLLKTEEAVIKFKELGITQRAEGFRRDLSSLGASCKAIADNRDRLEGNLTTLQKAFAKFEKSTSNITNEISMRINTVKTDVRRISGFETDINSLIESVIELENKLEKVEKSTVQSIGNSLADSIDRITDLKNAVSRNSDRIDLIKKRLVELRSDFSDNSEKLQNLESDRLKVMQAVHFANDLKPKVFTLRKDLSQVQNIMNDLSLRLGRLAQDLLKREREVMAISDQVFNFTAMKSEIQDLNLKLHTS